MAFAHLIIYLLYCIFVIIIGVYRIDYLYVTALSRDTYYINKGIHSSMPSQALSFLTNFRPF